MSFSEKDRPGGDNPLYVKKPSQARAAPGKPAVVKLVGRPLGEDGQPRRKVIDQEDMLNLRITLQSTKSVDEFLERV